MLDLNSNLTFKSMQHVVVGVLTITLSILAAAKSLKLGDQPGLSLGVGI